MGVIYFCGAVHTKWSQSSKDTIADTNADSVKGPLLHVQEIYDKQLVLLQFTYKLNNMLYYAQTVTHTLRQGQTHAFRKKIPGIKQ